MDVQKITKREYKILNMFYKHGPYSNDEINEYVRKHIKYKEALYFLHTHGYLEFTPIIEKGFIVGRKEEIRISSTGKQICNLYKDEHTWFDFEFVTTQILLPIVIAVITTVLTVYLTALR